ncbi:hypothetical protein HDV00_000860 [Rhizophlyctis rosea]|nr:hypothetical protein HDV00_000860 [Rhizophlyctis rosea]
MTKSKPAPLQPTPFFNNLSFTLKLTFPPGAKHPASPTLSNQIVDPNIPPTKIWIDYSAVKLYQKDSATFRSMTTEEWQSTAYAAPFIVFGTMDGDHDETMRLEAEDAKGFSVRELVQCVERWEQVDRVRSEWFGGVDCHHVFFEGVEVDEEGIARVCWGS